MTGTRVGGWILGDELGRGPLGTTYRAVAFADTTRTAAVKVLTHTAAAAPEFLARFPGEMLPLKRLTHPNIAALYEAGVHAGMAFYASELVAGTDVGTLARAGKKGEEPGLGWRETVLSVAAQAGRALRHAHHRSILHRDLKPSNLILTPDGTLKVTDFGLAKVFALSPLTLPPDAFGTAGFLAPEFFTGRPLTRKSDLYALGGVIYLLLTGRPPHSAGTTAEFMHKHCYVLPDRPMQFVPKLPPEFDELVCALLNKDPNRRPASAVAVLDELDQIRGKAERKGEKVTWPPDPGTATMPALGDDAPQSAGDEWVRPVPLFSRPTVVIPLFVAFVAACLLIWFWPRPTADALITAARPLVASSDPDDWDRAEDRYLTPLAERYPDQFADEVKAARTRIRDLRKLRKAVTEGRKVIFETEVERRYARGVAFAQVGEFDAARVEWKAVVDLGGAESARWIALATTALAELDKK